MHIYWIWEVFFSPANHFPKRLQLTHIGISFAGEKVSLSASSNKIAQGVTILRGTCWHSLTVLAQMCGISGSAWKNRDVSSLTAKVDVSCAIFKILPSVTICWSTTKAWFTDCPIRNPILIHGLHFQVKQCKRIVDRYLRRYYRSYSSSQTMFSNNDG